MFPTLIVALLSIFWSFAPTETAKTCFTPNDEKAYCIPIQSCAPIYDAIESSNLDPDRVEFFRMSQCGLKNGVPYVCCGTKSRYNSHRKSLSDRKTCGYQNSDRILNGEETFITEFPWMAILQYRLRSSDTFFACGGTLISPRYILTAAHCVTGTILTAIGPLIRIRLGEHDLRTEIDCVSDDICNEKPVDAKPQEIIPHPNFIPDSPHRYGDIALIRLDREIPKSEFIRPICLPSKLDYSEVGESLVVAGWGRTENNTSSPVKRKLTLKMTDHEKCVTLYRKSEVELSNQQICAGGEKNKDSCTGDSGGPLMTTFKNDTAQWYLEGIVSFGVQCGTADWPGIYTKVSEYLDWIERNIY